MLITSANHYYLKIQNATFSSVRAPHVIFHRIQVVLQLEIITTETMTNQRKLIYNFISNLLVFYVLIMFN